MSEESRLGREAIETAYALKQLVTAGVRVWFYLEDRERTLDSPTDKIMLSLTAFADELEREKARQRTYDAMRGKALAGHVTGGRLFGYDNVRTDGGPVVRIINEAEASVVRLIFELCAEGYGQSRIAKRLNEDGAVSPRPQQGRRLPPGPRPRSTKCSSAPFTGVVSSGTARGSATSGGNIASTRGRRRTGSRWTRPSYGSSPNPSGRRCKPGAMRATRSSSRVRPAMWTRSTCCRDSPAVPPVVVGCARDVDATAATTTTSMGARHTGSAGGQCARTASRLAWATPITPCWRPWGARCWRQMS